MEQEEPEKEVPAGGTEGSAPVIERPELPRPPDVQVQLPSVQKPGTSPQSEQYRQMGLAYSLPAALIAPVLVLTLLGAWLDSKFPNANSGFTLTGALLGLIVGVRNMIRLASRLGR